MTYAQVMPAARPARAAAGTSERDDIEMLAARLGLDKAAAPALLQEATQPPAGSESWAAGGRGVFLQLGAFSSAENAESLRSHLLRELDWLNEGIQISTGGGMHRVHLGPYGSRADAEKVAEKIRLALGYKPTFVAR
jgi:rare lipoprotein A